jgi:ABC-type multidrug transport system ATPase subunit
MTIPASNRPVVLRVEGLCFGFANNALFNDFGLTIAPGVTWVGGDESTGKTTLLRLLAAELAAQSGVMQINGIGLAEQAQAYRSQVFWVDPRTQVFDALSPQAYWDGVCRQFPAIGGKLWSDLVDGFSLAPHMEKSLYMLSTGTKRKVFLAAAFASGAALTLLDEPFAALDKASIFLVLELLREAASHPQRAWLVADYEAPRGVALAATVALRAVGPP